ncbi:UbiH/UbiF/VisC/COQ6 family ubiquinone biosynthesis hydroxylase [Maliponia aquimaris]|uniref:2-octaprenyl-6-methoxyphenol hydroxylase n=1 Tax=Maliponia aquimaris TaxID=1673631 RepID=A0A238KE23_9RHOB|nr:UbiH/UbiF/VisC/COQ6 family ubiquinone biosynthesis hydroxylase [Maliponia aquimaris]SMX40432.1 2-octaprenyl-6-methoxyphenol hydroxylase [Maliponia aquimaris]
MDNPARAAILRGMEHDLIIVGGGLNGPALALAAAEAGLSSCVVDALPLAVREDAAFDGRSYALARSSQRMLAKLGLWGALAEGAQAMNEIKVSDGRVGDAGVFLGLHFDSAEIEDGPMGYMVEDRYLRRVLLEALAACDLIEHRAEVLVVEQESTAQGVSVTLADGTVLRGRLLVGADGQNSGVATRAGIRRMGWRYGQTALVCAIAHEKPHNGVAHQLFLPPGPLAILPLKGNRSSIVWSETEARAKAINALDDKDYLEVLRPRFGDFLGAISLDGARYTYPLTLSLAREFVAERVALVGDAAHRMHPIAGQGLNAGLRDVAALAHVISHAVRRGEDFASPAVLARYAQWRRFDTAALAASTDLFNRLFSNDNPLLRAVRDVGMAAVGAWPGLRRGFIREAAGLTGELPDLMRA